MRDRFDPTRNPIAAERMLREAERAVSEATTPEEIASAQERWKQARLAMDLCNERCE